jgi:hypothetical protein
MEGEGQQVECDEQRGEVLFAVAETVWCKPSILRYSAIPIS